MKIAKKFSVVMTLVLILNLLLPISASAMTFTPTAGVDEKGNAVPLTLYSQSVYMINLDTGDVLVDINGEEERVPASLTKIMTAALVLEEFDGSEKKMKAKYVSSGSEAFDELYETGASTADIQPGEKVNYYDLLAALMLPSSCEAANIIAINLGGSISGFCDMMNEKAEKLGMKNTHFSNAHGLFVSQNYSSCKDIAILCKYLLDKYSVFREIIAMPQYQMESTDYHAQGSLILNTNYMLSSTSYYYYPAIKGIKTGSLDAAGRCFASYASSDGYNYLIVTMGAPMEKREEDVKKGEEDPDSVFADDTVFYNFLDHEALYDWAFNSLVTTDFINPNSEVTEATVEFGKQADYVNLKPEKGYSQLWPAEISVDEVQKEIIVKDNIVAPIETGDVLGEMKLSYNGETIASIDLVATSRVDRSEAASKVEIAKAFPKSTEFKYAMFAVIMVFAAYSIGYLVYMQLKYMKK